MRDQLSSILAPYSGQRRRLIPALQKIQEEFGYVSPEAISQIALALGTSENEVYGVASFYSQFRFTQPGKHSIKICEGTACHVGGSARILEEVERVLDVWPGGTTKDCKFSLERVACVGCCALAPVVVIDGTVYSKMTPAKTKETLQEFRD